MCWLLLMFMLFVLLLLSLLLVVMLLSTVSKEHILSVCGSLFLFTLSSISVVLIFGILSWDQGATNFVIFTDSLSALQALENFSSSQDRDICRLAQSLNKLLTCYDVQATLQWIPGHEDVRGNERADRLAKEGSKKEQYEKQCSYQTVKKIIKNNFKE